MQVRHIKRVNGSKTVESRHLLILTQQIYPDSLTQYTSIISPALGAPRGRKRCTDVVVMTTGRRPTSDVMVYFSRVLLLLLLLLLC